MIKKLICLLLVVSCVFGAFASQTYEIETKYGIKTLVIPDGYTELDVLKAVSKAYYEQDHDFNLLKEEFNNLRESTEAYKAEVNKLLESKDSLIKSYDDLSNRWKDYNKSEFLKGFVIGSAGLTISKELTGGVTLGAQLFNKVIVSATVNYPLSFTLGLGLTF